MDPGLSLERSFQRVPSDSAASRTADGRPSGGLGPKRHNGELLPDDYALLTIDFQDLATEKIPELPPDQAAFGDTGLRERWTPVLEVPSVIVPEGTNFLLNPAHPAAGQAHVINQRRFAFDRRLSRPL